MSLETRFEKTVKRGMLIEMKHTNFALKEQLLYQPTVANKDRLPRSTNHIVICGMGGSALAGSLLAAARQEKDIIVHRDFGLPKLHTRKKETFIIVCSHSGNTEEALSSYREARKKGFPVAVIAEQGTLRMWEQHDDVPAIIYPDLDLQPRHALWFQVVSLLALLGFQKDTEELRVLSRGPVSAFAAHGKKLARTFWKRIPVVYASRTNRALAYLWKISLNESAKAPAFSNVFPELDHNELTAWEGTKTSANVFSWLLLADADDDGRIQKRMKVFEKLWKEKGRTIEHLFLPRGSFWKKALVTFVSANTCANELARIRHIDPVNVPLVEAFKKRVAAQ